jgi:signal transduction histidine kinase
MARRIVITVLALFAAVLSAVAVPLGIISANQDRQVFTDGVVAAATSVANVAEERLDDGTGGRALSRLVGQFASSGDRVSVLDRAGVPIAGSTVPPPVSPSRLAAVRAGRSYRVYSLPDALLVLIPVRSDSGKGTVGVVALYRSSEGVDRQVAALWGMIAAICAAGLVAAALTAAGLARWVSRPLAGLESAAQRLGEGQLSTRSPADQGPAEVRQLAANFNLMAARLEALVHGHKITMADVSHQLRTPLAALRLRLELLAEDSDETVARELAGAQEEIARLSRLVNGMLAVARAENSTELAVAVFVDAVVRNRVAAWRPTADEQRITLAAPDLEPVKARMGEGQLEQILDNLIANSLDALPAGGRVLISSRAAAGRVRITIADDGPGMSDERKRLAFRRFASSRTGGTGIGLAIVDRLAVSSGGSVVLSDSPGGGLTVTIELPQAQPNRTQRRLSSPGRQAGSDRIS